MNDEQVQAHAYQPEHAYNFWHAKGLLWPKGFVGHVFLPDAIDQFGRAKFASDWTGREPVERFLPRLRLEEFSPDIGDYRRVWFAQILRFYNAIDVTQFDSVIGSPIRYEDWEVACALDRSEHETERVRSSNARMIAVINDMLDRLAFGTLRARTCQMLGDGTLTDMPTMRWITDSARSRFVIGLACSDSTREEALSTIPPYAWQEWINSGTLPLDRSEIPEYVYLETDGLDRAVRELQGKRAQRTIRPYAKAEVRRWFAEVVRLWSRSVADAEAETAEEESILQNRFRPSRQDVVMWSQAKFPGISENLVREIWNEGAPQPWRKTGPRGPRGAAPLEDPVPKEF